ncbi:MAG: flavodoxin domain-containing protein [Bacillota bacterium]
MKKASKVLNSRGAGILKGLICYDSKYGSTETVCTAVRSGITLDVDIKNIKDVKDLDYDFIVIASPIFIGKPMQSIEVFIKDNYSKLFKKNIAVMVTCWAASTKYRDASADFIRQIVKDLPECNLIASKALPGKLILDQISERDKNTLLRIVNRISKMAGNFGGEDTSWNDVRDDQAAKAFGEEIEKAVMQLKASTL